MNRQKELAKNTAILTLGKLLTKFVSFFLLPLYTAILSTEEYGQYDLLVTYGTLILPLVNWQMGQGLFRFMLDWRREKDRQDVLFSTLFTVSIFQCIIYFVIYIFIEPFLHIEAAYFLLFYVVSHVFTSILFQFVRGLGNNGKYAIASFISASVTTVLNVVMLVLFKMGLTGMYVSTLIAQMITLVYLVYASKCWKYYIIRKFDWSVFKSVCAYSIPLIPNNLAWWVVNASDRTVISYFLGVAVNGAYSVANKFPNLFIQFYNILNLSWTETVTLHFQDEDRDDFFTETMTSLFKVFSAACFGIVAIMPIVFPILVNSNYNAAYDQILILMYAMLLRVLVGLYSCVYIAEKKVKKIANTSILAAFINLSFNLFYIKKIGIYAASLSTLVAFCAMFIFRYIDVNKTVHMKIKKNIIIVSIIIGGINVLSYYSANRLFQIGNLILTVIYAIVINLDMVKSAVSVVKDKLER